MSSNEPRNTTGTDASAYVLPNLDLNSGRSHLGHCLCAHTAVTGPAIFVIKPPKIGDYLRELQITAAGESAAGTGTSRTEAGRGCKRTPDELRAICSGNGGQLWWNHLRFQFVTLPSLLSQRESLREKLYHQVGWKSICIRYFRTVYLIYPSLPISIRCKL